MCKPFERTSNMERSIYKSAVTEIIFTVHFTYLIYIFFLVENICACRNTYGLHEAWILQREEFNLKYVNIIKFPAILISDFGIEKRAEFKEKLGKKNYVKAWSTFIDVHVTGDVDWNVKFWDRSFISNRVSKLRVLQIVFQTLVFTNQQKVKFSKLQRDVYRIL